MNIYTHEEIRTPITKVEKTKKRSKRNNVKLSPAEILTMIKEVEDRFVKPTPQAELGGDLGVTLFEMADSLKALHKDIRKKVESELPYLTAFNFKVRKVIHTSLDNKTVESYVLDVMAAQYVLGGYNTAAGRYYRNFLLRCKDALTVSLIELEKNAEQIEYLKKRVAASEQKETDFSKKIREKRKYQVVLGEEFSVYDSDGLKKVAKVSKKTLDEMTNTERGLYNIQQNTRKQLGCHERVIELLIEHKCSDKNILHHADLCLDALQNFNSLVNKTGLERALEPKKQYIETQLFVTGEKPKYIK